MTIIDTFNENEQKNHQQQNTIQTINASILKTPQIIIFLQIRMLHFIENLPIRASLALGQIDGNCPPMRTSVIQKQMEKFVH